MTKRQQMLNLATSIANDDSHGYSQYRRWPSQGTDFDCSSLMYWAAHEAGYNVPLSGYTGTMLEDFKKAGFTVARWDGNIWDCEPGDILLAHNNNRQHTEMYVGNGQTVGAHIAETGGIDGQPGDQTGNEISIAPAYGSWDWVLTPPKEIEKPTKVTAKTLGYTPGLYKVRVTRVGVREARRVASTLHCLLAKGAKVNLDDLRLKKNGSIWGRIASGDHAGKFVCVRNARKVKRLTKVK